jgi:signal transduction histidine kinase
MTADPKAGETGTTQDPQTILEDRARLRALERTGLLDTPPEEPFDRLTRLAAKLLKVPVTFLSLLDRDRDFYKSQSGFPEPLASRRQIEGRTFCHYTLGSSQPLVIPDTHADPEFRMVPTVESLGVRAYAGVPLVTSEGHALGSFCAIDFAPREWTAQDLEILSEMSLSAMNEIALREAVRESDENLKLAREAVRAREEVLAAIAHDLRTPLSVLAGATAVLDASPALAPHAALLARMKRASESMRILITDMLEFAAPGAKPLRHPIPTAPRTLVDDTVSMLSPLALRHGIELVAQTDEGLPEVRVDYESILRVFSNLVGNALKVSEKGTTIAVGACAAGADAVQFSVADSGRGMSPADIEHIFERFWQKDRADHRGVGLGLSIVQSVVQAHGGRVTVESEEGVGSRFAFTLPASGTGDDVGG